MYCMGGFLIENFKSSSLTEGEFVFWNDAVSRTRYKYTYTLRTVNVVGLHISRNRRIRRMHYLSTKPRKSCA